MSFIEFQITKIVKNFEFDPFEELKLRILADFEESQFEILVGFSHKNTKIFIFAIFEGLKLPF